LTLRHLTCSWKVSSSSAGTIDTSAAIELLVHAVHSAQDPDKTQTGLKEEKT